MSEDTKFETWAVVEVMGHKRYAGFVTEQTVAGAAFVRVDVPDSEKLPAFTKLLGAGSIYAITPCTEETAKAFAAKLQERAFNTYEAPRLTQRIDLKEGGPRDDSLSDWLNDDHEDDDS